MTEIDIIHTTCNYTSRHTHLSVCARIYLLDNSNNRPELRVSGFKIIPTTYYWKIKSRDETLLCML